MNPTKAVWILPFEVVPPWVDRPEWIEGIYCGSDHLLNAYLRGYAGTKLRKAR